MDTNEPSDPAAGSQPAPTVNPPAPVNILYKDPNAAAEAVTESYNYWTGKLTESSFALSLAVIGANWAVFGSIDRVRSNLWSELSLATVLASLAIGLVGAWKLGGMLRKRAFYAEADRDRWQREFDVNSGKETPWPFTKTIDNLGTLLRWTRTFLPVAGGAFFVVALFCQADSGLTKVSQSKTPEPRVTATASPVASRTP
jgi:hypothetical protein